MVDKLIWIVFTASRFYFNPIGCKNPNSFFLPAEVIHRSAVFEFDLRQFKRHTDDWQKAFLKVFWTAREDGGENKRAA